jgi:hypothetical protein
LGVLIALGGVSAPTGGIFCVAKILGRVVVDDPEICELLLRVDPHQATLSSLLMYSVICLSVENRRLPTFTLDSSPVFQS